MEEDGEYADGEIVWVKLSYCWWPGEVLAGSRLTDEFLSTLKRRPLAVVKFFDEDSYEYVKNTNFIYKYNCSRKHEFLRKGLEQYRAKNKHMVKFPADVMQAERATGGDPNIVNSTEFLPQKRESYADIFSSDKSKGGKGKASATTPRGGSPKKAPAISPSKIIPVIPVRKHEVRILGQASSPSGIASRSSLGGCPSTPNNSSLNASTSSSVGEPGSSALSNVSAASPSQIYHCHKCGFESSRQNVIVLHTKYCRAVPLAPFNIPAVRESKSLQATTARTTTVEDPVTPKAAPKLREEPPQQPPAAAPADEEELVEVIQVVEEKTPAAVGRSGRTPRTAAKAATPTPKVDRRKNRGGRGKAVATPVVEVEAVAADEEKVEVLQVSEEEPPAEEVVPAPEVGKSLDDSTGKDSKGKADVELKNELLADWSEDEQDEQELKEDKRKAASSDESEKVETTEKAAPVISITDSSAEKSVESSPQLASPVSSSSGTTIKYRNIPKKQKREFIEVTNDQPATTQAVTIEKSSSESSISTAATCGDKTASSSSADSLPEQSRPLSAKQRILDRATRGSSKSNSSSTEELKPVIVAATAAASAESQHDSASTSDETKKDIASCFDFKEEEEEEVVLSKSPRRSLSNRRDVSLDAKQEQEELERAKKDAELKNEIDSLLNEVSVPSLPDLPKLPVSPRATSPGPSQEIISPQSKEEIDRNRTLPPKERGKRIFKTRNKPTVENEAIALEQSKAIVLDFVKKSHEEEEAQQQQEAKLSSESPTTTNDDSQESVLSAVATEPQRFENSEFAAIKAKRAKLPVEEEPPKEEESTVSSSNEEPKPATAEQPDSLPVSISKDQLTLEVLEITTPSPKSRKGKQQPPKQTIVSPIVLIEKLPEPVEEEQQPEVTPKATPARKKRAGEMDQLDLTALDTPRSRRGRSAKAEEPTPEPEPPKEIEAAAPVEKRKAKRGKKEEEVPAVDETPEVEPKPTKSKRSKQSQQRSADSTADLHAEVDPVVPTSVESAPVVSEPAPIVEPVVAKHQPIKMIIKSKGKKSNSELIYDDPVVAPEPKPEETQEKLPKSPKSSKRKKEEPAVEPPAEEAVEPLAKSPKSKRPKVKASEKPKEPEISVGGPSATDLQVAEALIQLPEAPVIPPKVAVVDDQEMVEVKSNNSSPVHPKTINPRKRHLQKLMDTAEVIVEQPPPEIVTIPEKKKRETIVEVVSVAPASIVQDLPAKTTSVVVASVPPPDEDKFDIDNIPIVMDDSELLEDSTISTTSNTGRRSTVAPVVAPVEDEDVKLISTTKPMTKKIVIVKSSNGSAKIVGRKESPAVAKKNLAIKSTTITIKPPLDQLSPTNVTTRSPAHSPTPMRSAQLVQASSGGQIVITSKGTVLTTQSPSTSTARSHSSDGLKTHVSQSHSKPAIVSSVVSSASSISSSSSSTSSATKELPESAANSTPQRPGTGAAAAIKSPAKICVQSQEIIHPATKPRPVASSPVVVQKVTPEVGQQHKKGLAAASASSQKKSSGKKQAEPGTSGGKPLFATSKGALITSQPATTSSVNPGKKNHRVIKISPQKLKEFTRLGMVEDKGKGKVLTASGMKKFRQEQEQLLQQQQQQQEPQSKPDKPVQRADSIDEEPSTSTPTPPPPADAPAEVVVAAAADSSVKELPPASPVEPEQSAEVAEEEPAKPEEIVEENEAAAAETEPECSSSSKVEPVPAAEEASESASAQPEVPAEATSESSSNVQESSQLIAVPAENFGGPANLFYLCSVREEGFVPVNNELLYLDSSNQLVALPEQASVEDIVQQAAGQEVLEIPGVAGEHAAVDVEGAVEAGQQNILLNTQDGQQIILDQQSLMALAAAGADTSQLLTPDGQQIVLQGSAQELLAALAVTQPGLGIAVAAEGTQIIVAPESLIDLQDAPLPGEIIQVNPNTTVETNAVLTKPPIMSTVEVPSKNGNGTTDASAADKALDPVATTNLDESLAAVIGVPGNPNVPTSLELPITVTNPVIAKTTTCKINPIYPTTTAIAAIPGVLDLPPTALAQTDPSTSIKSVWD
ncbi:titin isoform X2 [Culex quinquefasciatus]|uniref:titin isoform X2 n=1 Tax=Culex quinquefasciatus TaxID=7176 RepID=UPI0018E37F60|nr:titin isoform X2 [Culex quinquefasciatus]